jgi:hypothetical protein
MSKRTWQDDFELWNQGRLTIQEIERRLESHGLTEEEINQLLPDLVTMKALCPEDPDADHR